MARLSKQQIIDAPDIKSEMVSVPEWDGEVEVKTLSGKERDDFESQIVQLRGKKTEVTLDNLRAKLCSLAIIDEKGARMFDEDEVDDLGKKSAPALQRVFIVAQRLAGLTESDVENLVKN
jgi:hypothetical protein